MADELEDKLRLLLGEKFEPALAAKIAQFGGLLSRRAAIRLLCKEKGIETERRILLSSAASESLPFSFSARIDRIFPLQKFAGGEKCVRLHLSDHSGPGTLVLWNEQAALAETQFLRGDEVECRGAYFRSGEIHLGREGSISVAKKSPLTPVGKLTAGVCSTEGTVKEVYLDYGYKDKKSGAEKSMSSFLLCSGDDCRRVAVWSSPEGTPKVNEGDFIILENVTFKNSELHFNTGSRMVRRFSAAEKTGKLDSVKINEGAAVFEIGKEKFSLPLAEALALVGIRTVPEGVEPSTVLSIKAGALAGKSAKYRLADGKLSWLKIESAG